MKKPIVVHTISSLAASKGGPSRTVPRLCRELVVEGTWIPKVISTDTVPTSSRIRSDAGVEYVASGADAMVFWHCVGQALGPSPPASILHDHGMWLPTNAQATVRAWLRGVTTVISPRGMLEPWALCHRGWKKRAALATYQGAILRRVTAFHATSEEEASTLRSLGLRQPIAVIPNGVELPILSAQFSMRPARRQALFLSRLNVKKGLLPLLEAWARVRPEGWQLLIVGPDEGNHLAAIESTINRLALREHVNLKPEADDSTKWQYYAASELFVLPSFSENFGVVVAEALAAGVPAITTTGMPWAGVERIGCGWRIEPNVDSLARVLLQATALNAGQLHAMGKRGREWIAAEFSWELIGQSMAAFYSWLQTGATHSTAPSCVRLI